MVNTNRGNPIVRTRLCDRSHPSGVDFFRCPKEHQDIDEQKAEILKPLNPKEMKALMRETNGLVPG